MMTNLEKTFIFYKDLAISKSSLGVIDGQTINSIYEAILEIHDKEIEGDIMEVGAFRGNTALFMKAILNELGSDKKLYVYDMFESMPDGADLKYGYSAENECKRFPPGSFTSSIESVKEMFKEYNLLDDNVIFVKGNVEQTLLVNKPDSVSLLRIDVDLSSPYTCTLETCYDDVSINGYIFCDDSQFSFVKKAIVDFLKGREIDLNKINFQTPYRSGFVNFHKNTSKENLHHDNRRIFWRKDFK